MNFEEALKNMLEKSIASFNTGNYDSLLELLSENAQLISPEIKNDSFYSPETHAQNRTEIINYWKSINLNHDNRITDLKFLKTGKVSVVRCIYAQINIIIDSQIHMDEYGIIYKIINKVVDS